MSEDCNEAGDYDAPPVAEKRTHRLATLEAGDILAELYATVQTMLEKSKVRGGLLKM